MTRCRYCGKNLLPLASVHIKKEGRKELNECSQCKFASFYPAVKPETIRELLSNAQERVPAFDPNFEWRLFFARRYFHDGAKVLNIGMESKTLTAAFKKEQIELTHINIFNPKALEKFEAQSFDAVFIWDVLDFVDDFRAFMREIKRILKKDGYISLRVRDAFSRANAEKGKENLTRGEVNFLTREFLHKLYKDYFNDVPHCFMSEYHNDSVIVALGKNNQGSIPSYSMQVLVVVHYYLFSVLDDATGPRGRVLNTIDMLKRQGVLADISLSHTPSAVGYDLVHLFHNAWETQDALSQMTSVKADNAKVVISTIYMDPSETNFVINVINKIFKIYSEDERNALLNNLSLKKLRSGTLSQDMRFYARWNIEHDQKALLEMADRLICFSYTEMRQMSLNLNRTRPFSIVYNSANDETFGVHGPEFFTEHYGIKDFVIAAGHVEWRKNQLMLLYALRNYPEIPIVIVGAKTDEEYYELCRRWAHKNTLFISQLKHRHLASAFSAARVHALPSWIEGIALSTIESAMCGCAPVVADRAGEIEYYGDFGFYANPGSIDSIQRAVLMAYTRHTPEMRKRISEYVKSNYTFRHAVEMTIDAYRKTVEGSE